MNAITLSRLVLNICIGHKPEERREPQLVRIDLRIEVDFTEVLATGALEMGINYAELRRTIKEVAVGSFVLLEDLGDTILKAIFKDKKIIAGRVAVRKLKRWKDAVPGVIMSRRNI